METRERRHKGDTGRLAKHDGRGRDDRRQAGGGTADTPRLARIAVM